MKRILLFGKREPRQDERVNAPKLK